jgi:hypothetical protein
VSTTVREGPSTVASRTAQFKVHFRTGDRGRRRLRDGARPAPPTPVGRVPRISRLLALALRFDRLIRDGMVKDYADIARLGGVTRARVTQIMDLLNLAPDIQKEILLLPSTTSGRDPLTERQLRRVVADVDWEAQRRRWTRIAGESSIAGAGLAVGGCWTDRPTCTEDCAQENSVD